MENNYYKSNAGQVMGILALIFAVIGIITSFIPCFGLIAIVFGILAIIFGIIGFFQAKKENASAVLPLTGLILGIIATIIVLIWSFLFLGLFSTALLLNENAINSLDSTKIEYDNVEYETIEDAVEAQKDSMIWNDTVQTNTFSE